MNSAWCNKEQHNIYSMWNHQFNVGNLILLKIVNAEQRYQHSNVQLSIIAVSAISGRFLEMFLLIFCYIIPNGNNILEFETHENLQKRTHTVPQISWREIPKIKHQSTLYKSSDSFGEEQARAFSEKRLFLTL